MKKYLFFLYFAYFAQNLYAYDFEVNGIFYSLLPDDEVEVSSERNDYSTYQGDITIPSSVTYDNKEYAVKQIGNFAFASSQITKIDLPSSIIKIGRCAFRSCDKLVNITLPDKLETIGEAAFKDCNLITSITIPKSVKNIGGCIIQSKSLNSIIVESGNRFYDSRGNCNAIIESSSNKLINGSNRSFVPNGITAIGDFAFSMCEVLKHISIPESVSTIGEYAFEGCKSLTAISIPNSVWKIGAFAFCDCNSLTHIELPEQLEVIDVCCFSGCNNLLYVRIPDSVEKIESGSFKGCNRLKSILIPKKVTKIGQGSYNGDGSFYNCKKLRTVISHIEDPTITKIGEDCFRGTPTNCVLYVPNGKVDIYRNHKIWGAFPKITDITHVYTINVNSSDGGQIKLDDVTIQNNYTENLTGGSVCTLSFYPEKDKYLSLLSINGNDVTDGVINNNYTIGCLGEDTNIEAVFSNEPHIQTYPLTISVYGGSYNGTAIYKGSTIDYKDGDTFLINEGEDATIQVKPGTYSTFNCMVEKMIVNKTDVSSFINNDSYTIKNIHQVTDVQITYNIAVGFADLFISAEGNGSVKYEEFYAKNSTLQILGQYGTSTSLTIVPEKGYSITSLKVNGVEAKEYIVDDTFTLYLNKHTSVVVLFSETDVNQFFEGDIKYEVLSFNDRTIKVLNDDYRNTLIIPEKVIHGGLNWTVREISDKAFANCKNLTSVSIPPSITAIGNNLFENCPKLASIKWDATLAITDNVLGTITNPNLLLYVSNKELASGFIHNVVVGRTSESIILSDALGGNNFFCSVEFTANVISYTHRFGMTSGMGTCQGWETLVLPFDVQEVRLGNTVLVPFAKWNGNSATRPFWLYELTSSGFRAASSIRANTPYIISMPNNTSYDAEWNISGDVTFSATQARVYATTQLTTAKYNGKTFTPCYTERPSGGQVYALNVNNLLGNHANGYAEGSVFVNAPARTVHPFEAYLETQTASAKTAFSIFEDMTEVTPTGMLTKKAVYNLSGQLVKLANATSAEEAIDGLPAGIYIVDGKKVVRATP